MTKRIARRTLLAVVELRGAERDWKILRPRKWFAEYPPLAARKL